MGFTSGFAGGVTVTLGIAYLTVLAHERNRQAQALALRSQSRVLESLLEPAPLSPPRSRAELAREERSTFAETAKDRWNNEVENAVRWVQRKDWGEVRESMEDSVARLLGGGLQKSREGIEELEKTTGPKVQDAIDRSRAAGKNAKEATAAGIDKAAQSAISGAEKAGVEAKESARRTREQFRQSEAKTVEYRDTARAQAGRAAEDARTGAQDAADAIRTSGGTIDAARSAVRGVISKGFEKGKEAIGIAQNTISLAEEKLGAKTQTPAPDAHSAVEKALKERYEKRPEQSVAEALEERYKPISAKDNTTLRGV